MADSVQQMLSLRKWAVLGVSSNLNKFGYRIFSLLKRYGYEVYAVNPKETVIDGEPCYPSLRDLPVLPEVVDFVVPPAIAMEALSDCASLGIRNVWLQPGVNTPEVIDKARTLGLTVIFDRCALVESSKPAMLAKKSWAVIGNADEQTARLRDYGYSVSVLPSASWQSLAAIAPAPEVVLFAGALAESDLQDCQAAGIEFVWLEPGVESDTLIAFGNSLHLVIVHHAIVIDELTK